MLTPNSSWLRQATRALIVVVAATLGTVATAAVAVAQVPACTEHVYIFQTNSSGATLGLGFTDSRNPGGFNMNTRDTARNYVTMGGETRPRRPATFHFKNEAGNTVFTKTTTNSDDGGVIRQEPNVMFWSIAQPGQRLQVFADFHTRCGGDDVKVFNRYVGAIVTYPSAPVEVNPKYVVLSVAYAPPGRQSSVDYGQSTTVGSRVSFSNSFQGGISVTNVNPINERRSISTSTSFTQRATSGGSDAVEKSQSSSVIIPGPAAAIEGISHDFDLFEVWLNPRFTTTATSPTALETSGFSVDTRDPVPGMDIVRLSVRELKNPSLIPPGTASRLARPWSPTGALTQDDFNAILAHNPFANGGTAIDPTRFTLINGANFDYRPADPGGQPVTERFSVRMTESAGASQSFTTTVKVDKTVSTTSEQNPIADFEAKLKVEHKVNRTAELTFSLNLDQTNVQTQSTSVSITGPGSGYQGPTALRMYQDNRFGTVMFAFAPVPTFQVGTPSPNQTVVQSGTATFPITTQSDFGFQDPVSFDANVMGLPAGAQATFSPTSVLPGQGASLNVTTTAQTPPGAYELTFTAFSGFIRRHRTVNLTVQPLPFTLTATPSTRTVASGQTTTYTVNINPANGFSGPVQLSGPGNLPPGATATFNPSTITGGGSSTLTVTTSASTPAGTRNLTITATGGGSTRMTTVSLVVDNTQDFGMSVTPQAAGVAAGQTATYTVTTTAINGFTGNVNLTVAGQPSGSTPSFSVNPIPGAGSSTLSIATSTSTPPGDYNLTVTGTSGSIMHIRSVVLSVSPPLPDFTLTSTPDWGSAAPGESTSFTVSTGAVGAFNGDISLSMSGMPSGVSGDFTASPVTVGSGSTLNLQVHSGAPPGDYPITITGTSGNLTRSETVMLTVAPPVVGFTLAVEPETISIPRNLGSWVDVLVTGVDGFTGAVELSVTDVPTGVNMSFDTNPVWVYGSTANAILYLSVGESVPPGTYPITVTGVSDGISQSRTFTLNVT